VAFENDFIAFLTYDDEHHRIAIVDTGASEAPPPTASGVEHIAFTYGSLEDLVGTYERLKGQGLQPYWTINHGPTTSCYYRDPDGNQVELQIDNFESIEALHDWFRSGAFAQNPIGVEFDVDDLVARFRAGVPQEELVRRP
jgi:catechol-2,3-dioxygenase